MICSGAQRLLRKVHPDPIDPQFRIATPEGDFWLGVTLPDAADGRARLFTALKKLLAYKRALAFTLASESHVPDAVMCIGVSAADRLMCLSRIEREPLGFSEPEWMASTSIDPMVVNLMPNALMNVTGDDLRQLQGWFGADGMFPIVHIESKKIGL